MGLSSGGPYALPDGTQPLIFMDFVNEVYEVDGEPVAVGALLTENLAYGGAFDPETAIVNGVGISTDADPVMTGDALDLILGGSTIIYEFTIDDDQASTASFIAELIDFPDFNTYYFSSTGASQSQNFIGDNVASNLSDYGPTPGEPGEQPMANGPHKIAVTMASGKIVRSIDGRPVLGIDPAATWTVPPTFFGMQFNADVTIKYIGIYPQQDDANLPGLSAL